MTSNVVPADDDLVERLRTCRVACAAGPAYDWLHPNKTTIALVEESADRIASLSSELARCRNALEEARARFVDIANAAPLGPQDAISTWRALAEARFSVAFCALATIDAALNPIGERDE